MNPKIAKLKDEKEKIIVKLNKGQARLREIDKQLLDLENADIVAAVRGVDIAPDELAAFVQMFREKQQGTTVPNLDADPASTSASIPQNDEEDSI